MYFEITNYTLIIFSKEANDGLRSRVIFDPSLSRALSKRIFNKEEFNIAGSLEKRSSAKLPHCFWTIHSLFSFLLFLLFDLYRYIHIASIQQINILIEVDNLIPFFIKKKKILWA